MKKIRKFFPMIAFNVASIILFINGYGWYAIIPSAVYWWMFCYLNKKVFTVLVTVVALMCLVLYFALGFNVWVSLIPGYIFGGLCIAAVKMMLERKKRDGEILEAWKKKAKKRIQDRDGNLNFSKRLKLQSELHAIENHSNNKEAFQKKGADL